MTYSLTRFAIYESVRDHVTMGSQGPLPFYKKVLLGSISGELPAGLGWAGEGGGMRASPVAACWLWGLSPQVASEASWGPLQIWSTSGQCAHPPRSGSFLSPDGTAVCSARKELLTPWGPGRWGAGRGGPSCSLPG